MLSTRYRICTFFYRIICGSPSCDFPVVSEPHCCTSIVAGRGHQAGGGSMCIDSHGVVAGRPKALCGRRQGMCVNHLRLTNFCTMSNVGVSPPQMLYSWSISVCQTPLELKMNHISANTRVRKCLVVPRLPLLGKSHFAIQARDCCIDL